MQEHEDPRFSRTHVRFSVEDMVRQRYESIRRKRRFDLSSVLHLAALIFFLSLIIVVLTLAVAVLTAVLFVSPFIIIALSLAQVFDNSDDDPRRGSDDGVVIEVEPENVR